MELRTVVSKVVRTFDVSFAPGKNGNCVIENAKDNFTLSLGQLELVFHPVIPFLESGWSALAISVPGVILKLQLVHLIICR